MTHPGKDLTYGSGITPNVTKGVYHAGSSLAYPESSNASLGYAYIEASFQYTVMPEPATLSLLLAAGVGVVRRRCR